MTWIKTHNHFWPEVQDTEASVSGQKSSVWWCFSVKCSQYSSALAADTDPLPGALQHPWLWRQGWLLWAPTGAVSFLSWGLSWVITMKNSGLNCIVWMWQVTKNQDCGIKSCFFQLDAEIDNVIVWTKMLHFMSVSCASSARQVRVDEIWET